MKTLLDYRKNYYSQFGEDGVTEEILRRLNIDKGWFVEVGAWDGKYLSNTFFLLQKGWLGIAIEKDKARYEDLVKTASDFEKRLYTFCADVGIEPHDSLDSFLSKTSIPKDFEVLSIDIDSYDWWVWKALDGYYPKAVIIEINNLIPLGINYIQPCKIGYYNQTVSGSSFKSTLALGMAKGYRLVCHTHNMFFVRKDLAGKLDLPHDEIANPDSLFVKDQVLRGRVLKAIFVFILGCPFLISSFYKLKGSIQSTQPMLYKKIKKLFFAFLKLLNKLP